MAQPYSHLMQKFAQVYPDLKPDYVVRVPGRVNLIGEHTDYNGLPVMPMAIEREVRIVLANRDDNKVQIRNVTEKFGTREFTIIEQIPAYEAGDWGNYAKAGVQGVIGLANELGIGLQQLHGFAALIESDLPMAAGLSSSSAMVVASALACLTSNAIEVDRATLAEHMAGAERYVGTMGGGMDQAAVLLAQAGAAIKIDFFPVRTTPVTLPADYTVVICNSLVVAPKSATARLQYNRRPIECRLAAALLARHLDGRNGAPLTVLRISELLPFISSGELLAVAHELFGSRTWTKQLAADVLGMNITALDDMFFRMRDGQILPEFADGLPLMARLQHVLSEGERVEASVAALSRGDTAAFSELMNASHASCRDQYGISCPELEALVGIARQAGAVGSRLTGAGFGGCTVSLVPTNVISNFCDAMIGKYYNEYLKQERPDIYQIAQQTRLDNLVIMSAPSKGAEAIPV